MALEAFGELKKPLPHLFERGWGIGSLLGITFLLAGSSAFGYRPRALLCRSKGTLCLVVPEIKTSAAGELALRELAQKPLELKKTTTNSYEADLGRDAVVIYRSTGGLPDNLTK